MGKPGTHTITVLFGGESGCVFVAGAWATDLSDESVAAALRSDARTVVVEAPAGCGKTHQGATYAKEAADLVGTGRVLILTHTHAARSVFMKRTTGHRLRTEIRTIDGLVSAIAGPYAQGLGLQCEVGEWIRSQQDGYAKLTSRVVTHLEKYPFIASALANRFPVVICDEHQDSSEDQHRIITSIQNHGSLLRIFGDPMQGIYKDVTGQAVAATWDSLLERADTCEELDTPHRWASGCTKLGAWTLDARQRLRSNCKIALHQGNPPSVITTTVTNQALGHADFRLSVQDRKQLEAFVDTDKSLMILTATNDMTRSLSSFFNRRIPIWEGHTRYGLDRLAAELQLAEGDPARLALAVVGFMKSTSRGFSPSAFGDRLVKEAGEGCAKPCAGKPFKIQTLARYLVEEPSHIGMSKLLKELDRWCREDPDFRDVKFDCPKEFRDAIHLGSYAAVSDGLADIAQRRSRAKLEMPPKTISTIHKAKGLECERAVIVLCDAKTFPDKHEARCLMYVALSRAKSEVMFVLPSEGVSPLIERAI